MLLLQLRNELWKLFCKKRTYIGFGVFLVAQNAAVLICYYNEGARRRIFAGDGEEFFSSLTCATVMILPLAFILLPLYIALVGGDLVIAERVAGLQRDVSRHRLHCLPPARYQVVREGFPTKGQRRCIARWASNLNKSLHDEDRPVPITDRGQPARHLFG